jgi:hypothetical protein
LANKLDGDIKTNFQVWDLGNILSLANSLNSGSQFKHSVISTENYLYETHSEKGEYILLPKAGAADYTQIQEFFKSL